MRRLPLPGIPAQAAIDDPALRAAYAACRRFAKTANPTEYSLMQLMPAAMRPSCWALWTALSVPDNIIDTASGTPAQRVTRMRAWITSLEADVKQGTSSDPFRRAIVDTVWRWNLNLRDLSVSFSAIEADAEGRRPATWTDWSARVQRSNASWAGQCLILFNRAGLPTPMRPQYQRDFARYLDGVYLTDTLADLSADLDRGALLLPAEVIDGFDATPADLLQRRWTPQIQALITHLVSRARHQLNAPAFLTVLHPGAVALFTAVSNLFLARLRAVERAGPRLLHTGPRPGKLARQCILAPARAKAALAWQMTPLNVPRTPSLPPQQIALPLTPAARPAAHTPPRPHASGVRPPAIAPDRMPRHVAIIMDGNGRWAAGRDLPRHEGHRAGRSALLDVIEGAREIGLQHLTVYAFSSENWQRSPEEVAHLLELARDGRQQFVAGGVRLRWAGSPDGLPEDLVDELHRGERETRGETGLTLTICFNYGGRAELAGAAADLARAAVAGDLDPNSISEHLLGRYLPNPDMPDVDLLWRTGGEHRISNFLPWQTSYAELHFTDGYWPDVDRRDLWQAIVTYGRRDRRHGTASATPRPAALAKTSSGRSAGDR
ncbi:polyprenyl diphosphate synthase [Streptomyces nondiastaticus]|uniref:Isoprenyl transferase n=1 Tax=Streptomyces nondiastaticus TaxID=3154512 RepID=A0ABW6U3R2_9ACTN